MASDCNVELHKNMGLISRFDEANDGNVVQCGEIGGIGADTTFTLALGYGGDAATALAAAEGSLAAGFPDRETAYRKGWSDYVDGLRSAPSSVSTDTLRRRVYYTSGDGAARRRGQDVPGCERRRLRHAMGRFRQRRPAERRLPSRLGP